MLNEKYLEIIKKFRLIDDTFFNFCFDDNPEDVQYILRIILEKPDLKVLKVQTQKSVENVYPFHQTEADKGKILANAILAKRSR